MRNGLRISESNSCLGFLLPPAIDFLTDLPIYFSVSMVFLIPICTFKN
jgi:hypothetical protein